MRQMMWAVAVLAIAVAASTQFAPAQGDARVAKVVRVIDGDTFEIAGGAKVRVRNFDTPELRTWECQEERMLARSARDAARRTLMNRTVTLSVTGQDRYRRLVADVTVHEGPKRYDFVEHMVAEGHGARWAYGFEPQPDWCPQRAAAPEQVAGGFAGWIDRLFGVR